MTIEVTEKEREVVNCMRASSEIGKEQIRYWARTILLSEEWVKKNRSDRR
jgi:hypothetical protein